MRILLLHTDFIEWEAKKKAVEQAEKAEKKKVKVEEALAVFTAVEEEDGKKAVENARKEIVKVFDKVEADRIALYPYSHLSSNLASPSRALKRLDELEKGLKKETEVVRAPFGWYKAFSLRVKGHPLSELSKEISEEEKKEESKALKKEKELKSEWYIVESSGEMKKIEMEGGKIKGYNFKGKEKLKKLCKYEMAKSRKVKKKPPHIKLMRKLQLVDYEQVSDPGNFRFLPNGKLVKSLLEDWVTRKTVEYGAMEVETPVMYDTEHPTLKSYLDRFPARQYTIKTPNKRVFLRFAACFGQFLIAHGAEISYKNLPLRMYEMTRYSFRVEQRGELAGLRRLRSFSMPDCHAFCRDLEQAKEEMFTRFKLAEEIQSGMGLENEDFEFSIRVVKDFLEENKDYIKELVEEWGKPVLMEVWDKRFFYFILKLEMNFIDALDKAACLMTDQIDVENAERYGITFTDKDNKQKHPLILHLSPSGSIERVMYALLEKAYMEEKKGNNPTLPLWLSPTQVRLCPVNDSFNKYCEKIADQLEKEEIRVDIDDRTESVQKKIRDGEVEWVPFIVVIGEKEKKSGNLAVRFRETGKVKEMETKKLAEKIKKETKGMPFKPLSLPRKLTRRPTFIG